MNLNLRKARFIAMAFHKQTRRRDPVKQARGRGGAKFKPPGFDGERIGLTRLRPGVVSRKGKHTQWAGPFQNKGSARIARLSNRKIIGRVLGDALRKYA